MKAYERSDAISRSALMQALMPYSFSEETENNETAYWTAYDVVDFVYKAVKNAPDLDVAPVVHARWKIDCDTHVDYYGEVDEDFFIECPICGRKEYNIPTFAAMDRKYEETTKDYPYCHCGARMDGEAE